MAQKNELIAYALDFTSYLIFKVSNINRVILHGSIARGDFDNNSDIDLFIDCENKLNKITTKTLEDYQKTTKFKEWKLKGINNDLSLITGKLDSEEWKNLKRAIINTGIILYGKYKAEAEKINHYVLFSFENIHPNKKRILIFRKLYGFKVNNKYYSGIMDKYNGIKIGKGAILIPVEHSTELKKYFQDKKVIVKLFDLWSDTKIKNETKFPY